MKFLLISCPPDSSVSIGDIFTLEDITYFTGLLSLMFQTLNSTRVFYGDYEFEIIRSIQEIALGSILNNKENIK